MADHSRVYEDDIDFAPLLVPNIKFALRCETEDEAIQFLAAVESNFPSKDTYVTSTNPRWNEDNYGRDGGRAYFPDLNYAENDPIMTGAVEYAIEYGYTIVYFRDLIVQKQIEESDMPIDILFAPVK